MIQLLISMLFAGTAVMAEQQMLYDFRDPGAAGDWIAVNDNVMGGVSMGGMRSGGEGSVLFAGTLSLKNNGGFSSIRSRPRNWDLGAHDGIAIRVRGDGRSYKLNLRTDGNFDGINYRVEFDTTRDEWQTWKMPFDEFRASFRGRYLRDAPPLDPERIASVGVLISDKREDPFRLEIAWIAAYSESE